MNVESTPESRNLFICGVGRSGTTALAELLNLHPNIVMGIERYKYVMIGGGEEPVDYDKLFTYDRFFDYRETDTNVLVNEGQYQWVYEQARQKFSSARYVGDKIPGLYKRIPFLFDTYPDCHVIYIYRDPVFVASSWEKRAEKGGSWPSTNGYKAAVEEWNRSIGMINRLKGRGFPNLHVVEYERLFGDGGVDFAAGLLSRLGLEFDPAGEMQAFLGKSARKLGAARSISQDIVDFVQSNADYSAYEELSGLAA